MISGRATAEGTQRFRKRFAGRVAAGHFRQAGGLWLSSIGLGTYLGAADDSTDAGYEAAVEAALERGCNVFDAAINYRDQRSERAVGRALARAFASGLARRDEVFVSTKGGFLAFDAAEPGDPRALLRRTYFDSGLLEPGDVAAGCHAMTPRFLADQLERSRRNLGLETVDLYYLHNPETQLGEQPRQSFDDRLSAAVVWLETAVRDGAIGAWGLATWDGLRAPVAAPSHLSLAGVRARSSGPGFLAVQLPLNIAMPEALAAPTQELDDVTVPALVAARGLGLATFTSASILQGRSARGVPERIVELFAGLATDVQRALQFTRSAPGVTTALVGMSRVEHVRENLAVARVEPAPPETYRALFGGR